MRASGDNSEAAPQSASNGNGFHSVAQARVSSAGPAYASSIRPAPATSVLAGTVPYPLLSSRARGWAGLTVELHSFQQLDALVQPPDHVISVHLAGGVNLQRTRNGRTKVRKMAAGDVAITPVGSPVRWAQSSHSLVILLRLAPAYMQGVAGDEGAIDPDRFNLRDVFATRDTTLEDVARRLLAALELEGADSLLHVDTLTTELAIHLLRSYTTTGVREWPKSRLSPHKLRRAIGFIDDNLDRQVTLAALAEVVALSPGHFAHAFREATGVAPHRYVIERRVDRAKALLRQSDLPITEIADRIGCSSHSHFSVLFHRVTGLTPRQYRALD